MPINSPLPVRLPEECRKAANIVRSFVDSGNNGLDKVIPRSVLERAAGFAIFTVFKAGFMFSARAGSGVVIARLPDGSWSPPSAIGLGGFGFGGQLGAEVTDFLIVLNSRSAVASFMSAGSLTLGGNLSVAVGPLGRNAEGSGSVNANGRVAAMYSYSKTKGLFGGVSVEGSVIVERQDANRLAYGGNPSAKQILSGAFDPPEWAMVLIDQLENSTGLPGGQKWRSYDEEGEGGAMGYGSPGGSGYGSPVRKGSSGYVFSEGIGSGQTSPGGNGGGRKRSGSLFNPGQGQAVPEAKDRASPSRPWEARRASSFMPFTSGQSSPRRGPPGPSSETYNAESGPIVYPTRSRGGSSAPRPDFATNTMGSPFASELDSKPDLLEDWDEGKFQSGNGSPARRSRASSIAKQDDLLGSWDTNGTGLTASFNKLTMNGKNGNGRDRSGSASRRFEFDPRLDQNEEEDDPYAPRETTSSFATRDWNIPDSFSTRKLGDKSPRKFDGRQRNERPFSSYMGPMRDSDETVDSSRDEPDDPFTNPTTRQRTISASRPFDSYFPAKPEEPDRGPRPNIQLKAGLEENDGYARAVALFDFAATQSGDLGLKAGKVVVVLDKVGAKGEWWMGRTPEGQQGMFPCSYVEVLDIPRVLKGGVTKSELKSRVANLDFD